MISQALHSHAERVTLAKRGNKLAGMTLLEIIIVVALLGTLGVYLITNLTQQADTAKVDQTKLAIGNIRQALQLYRVHMKKYPTTDTGLQVLLENPGDKRWRGPYIDNANKLMDPWDAEFEYESDGRNIKIMSAGPDFQMGTDDDVIWPEDAAGGGGAGDDV